LILSISGYTRYDLFAVGETILRERGGRVRVRNCVRHTGYDGLWTVILSSPLMTLKLDRNHARTSSI